MDGVGFVGLCPARARWGCGGVAQAAVQTQRPAAAAAAGARHGRVRQGAAGIDMRRMWRSPKEGWDEKSWEREDYGFGEVDEVKRKKKEPSIPRSKMKEWCRKHGCSFRTEVTMRPQRHYPEPWFCATHVRTERKYYQTVASATSKLKSVDASICKMYRRLLKEPNFTRWDDPLF
mmetsp:Transcript_8778/g.23021  ORF Transcript_8778/g.23021 Transcript_8778/m.23021 type:complete len:175 (-) Transcript_8778:293-817(-)|eukprot:CAMPEP_0185836740 /NCGR_PEP_ID=MMETSP1353-20130828/10221_1 /TAXON_ID=1077150 /ORGANISM="Erythrolobus australicus, Strain CCMP3124" /LENGTH=174 /DNA_ID=CAMNT_0028535565 /DNA_START=30 /DNA_END=554 /DNA_ORIENTATION=-